MTWVKICGTTNLEDALTAVEAGADAVGFVFYEKSPRNVSVEIARAIVENLPEHIETVGVFVGADQAVEKALAAGLDAMQSYIVIDPKPKPLTPYPPEFRGLRQYLAMPYSSFLKSSFPESASTTLPRLFDALFIDSGSAQLPGGTGKTFNWLEAVQSLKSLAQHTRVVIAGGLAPDNVGEAMGLLQPFGVDVVSGVESRPGKKDPDKVRAFIRAVREHDAKVS